MKKKTAIILIIILVVIAIVGVVIYIVVNNARKKNALYLPNLTVPEGDEKVLLVEYDDKVVGTNGGDGTDTTSLYYTKEGRCEVYFTHNFEGEGEPTTSKYEADEEVIDDVYDIIKANDMASWEKKYKNSTNVICGAAYILKFRDGNGDYDKASTEAMPDNGIQIMESIDVCIRSHIHSGGSR